MKKTSSAYSYLALLVLLVALMACSGGDDLAVDKLETRLLRQGYQIYDANLSGTWVWEMIENTNNRGVFYITETDDAVVTGSNVVVFGVDPAPNAMHPDAESITISSDFLGEKLGAGQYQFEVETPGNKRILNTAFVTSEDGNTLRGFAKNFVTIHGEELPSDVYEWIAVRQQD